MSGSNKTWLADQVELLNSLLKLSNFVAYCDIVPRVTGDINRKEIEMNKYLLY